MTSRKIFLHIGVGKTGTTAIQNFCLLNRDKLRAKGYVYPEFGLYGVGHHLLGHLWGVGWMPEHKIKELVEDGIWARVRKNFLAHDANFIISTETLSTAFSKIPQSLQDVCNALRDCNVTVIVYLRRQDLHAESVYNQRIKTGHSSEAFDPDANLPAFYDYYSFLKSIEETFGKENMKVRIFERSRFSGPHIFSDFLSACDLPWEEDYKLPENDPNPRLDPGTLEFLRIANKIERPWEQKYLFNKAVLELTRAETKSGEREECGFLSRTERMVLLEKYSKSNRKVAKEYVAGDIETLFAGPVSDLPDKQDDTQDISLDKVVALAVRIWEANQNEANRHGSDDRARLTVNYLKGRALSGIRALMQHGREKQ